MFTVQHHLFLSWLFKCSLSYVVVVVGGWGGGLYTCQAQAPLAQCCLIHAQSRAARELFCHLYVESSFCVPDLEVFFSFFSSPPMGTAEVLAPAKAMHRARTAPCWPTFPIVPASTLGTKWPRIARSNLFAAR